MPQILPDTHKTNRASTDSMIALADLPQDILLLILAHLEAYDLLCLQLTSSTYRTVFSEAFLLHSIIRSYPNSREARVLFSRPHSSASFDLSDSPALDLVNLFRTLATRSYHLSRPRPRSFQRVDLRALDQSGQWFPPPQWDCHESQPGGRLYHESAASHLRVLSAGWKPYLFRPTLWSYDDGMLVYAPALTGVRHEFMRHIYAQGDGSASGKSGAQEGEDRCLRVVDLEEGSEMEDEGAEVPFDVREKIIRNIRLKDGLLVVEWAEKESFHDLNMVDRVHRHFATLFDVRRPRARSDVKKRVTGPARLIVTFRSEFKIHFLGFPLTSRDYFFSTHTAIHYALYYWQPNRSLWTGDEDQPIEALAIWDIGSPSPYRPSLDPSGSRRPDLKGAGPTVVSRFSWRELDWLGLRQGSSIALLGLELCSHAQTMTVKENTFVSGQGYFDPAERNWSATVTTFPFLGFGPVLQRRGEIELPSYRGHCSMESVEIDKIERWYLPIMDVVDRHAKVRFGLIETCFTGLGLENRIMLRVKVDEDDEWKNLDDNVVKELGAMGRIAGDERWIVGQNAKLQIVVARFQ